MTPVQRRIAELNSPESPLWRHGTPEQEAATAGLRKLVAQDRTEDERTAFLELAIHNIRETWSLNDPTRTLPPVLRGRWDSDREAEALGFLYNQGVDAKILKELHAFYLREGVSAMGDFPEADYERFAEEFKGRLSDAQIPDLDDLASQARRRSLVTHQPQASPQ